MLSILKHTGLLLVLVTVTFACTADELTSSRMAEGHFVDLLYALHHEDAPTAMTAASELSDELSVLNVRWYRPMEDEEADNMYFRLSRAQGAFTSTREAIAEGDLELATVQLDRAAYELSAADPVAFNQLYVGSIYDFIITWLEVSQTINDQALCQLSWGEFSRYGKDARFAWRQARWRRPSAPLYLFSEVEAADFEAAHGAVGTAIDNFITEVDGGDQCAAQEAANEVDDKLWDLLRCFSSASVTNL